MMSGLDASMQQMRTTVNVDDRLLAEARAVRTRRGLGDIVDDAFRVLFVESDGEAGSSTQVSLPTKGPAGLQPGVELEDKQAMTDLLGDDRWRDAVR